jgi:hypothetical protein
MTRTYFEAIPDRLLQPRGSCHKLIDWLTARGLSMTLLELEEERRRRGMRRTRRAA